MSTDDVKALVEAFCDEVETEQARRQRTGQKVTPLGDLTSASPATLRTLLQRVADFRAALARVEQAAGEQAPRVEWVECAGAWRAVVPGGELWVGEVKRPRRKLTVWEWDCFRDGADDSYAHGDASDFESAKARAEAAFRAAGLRGES